LSRPDASSIAADVKAGRTTAEAVIRHALDDIASSNGDLNAFTAVFATEALDQARRLDADIAKGRPAGALTGVPFAVKNLFDVEGVVTLAGSKTRRQAAPAARDAALIARLKEAGAILVGALNMDEFAYGFVTENAHYGATRNPHDLTRIAGGSSGGSAAAVAAGLVPLALGSDTNGSVRIPAGLCGIYGLKPTAGRLSLEGVFPFVESLDHAGLFARTVADLTLAYEVMLDDPAPVFGNPSLRAAVLQGWFTQGASTEVLGALQAVGATLDADFGLELPGAEAARSAAFCLSAYEGARLHMRDLKAHPQDFDPAVRDRLLAGALLPDAVADQARRFRPVFQSEAAKLFDRYDILLAPVAPCTAPRIGEASMMIGGEEVSVRKNLGAYTQPLSYIGLPVLAAPVNRPGQLPIGVQLIAAPGREDRLFAAAARLEAEGVIAAHKPRNLQ
jgi:aspartyl-tRNA(Asn)/glutamyl-tRNA(Gln) amidotransferase subunit A